MEIREGDNLLKILLTDTSPPDTSTAGDLRLSVHVTSDGFAGSSPHVWVDATTFGCFVENLHELEVQRQGTARLEADSSPDEFWLEIRAIDRAGHMAAFGQLRRWHFMSTGKGYYQEVTFGFEFCPSRLPKVVAAFQAMKEDCVP